MPTINFPGGAALQYETEEYSSNFDALVQNSVVFPLAADGVQKNLFGKYVVKVESINPYGFEDVVWFAHLEYGQSSSLYSNILEFSSLTNGFCKIIILVEPTADTENIDAYNLGQGQPGVEKWTFNKFTQRLVELKGTSSQALAGTWTWNTVPSAPSVTTVLNGTNVTVTRGSSTTTSEGPITGYQVQRRESVDGTTWGSWANNIALSTTTFTHTYTSLTPGKYYQFRVYATNNAGNSEGGTSGTILIPSIARNTGTAFMGVSSLKRYNGSAWQNITQARRWNGTSWVTVDITGVNST